MEEKLKLLTVLRSVNDEIDFESETAMVDDGLIDSLEITIVLAALNDAFGIRIQVGDIEPENFNSLEAILDMVRRYQGRR